MDVLVQSPEGDGSLADFLRDVAGGRRQQEKAVLFLDGVPLGLPMREKYDWKTDDGRQASYKEGKMFVTAGPVKTPDSRPVIEIPGKRNMARDLDFRYTGHLASWQERS
mmetsp:Transcript_12420/g.28456  ORF Transcript_12420/g.28456 Transcript_12420/m.28456 type:complete len:109 (-) Transcript_12420:13-339(-)|eukprot:CAMPEP_0197892152 /NCGR_PEP_ID=MMETSP1439-20131203/29996_1 /TAXON_ID=66791 /ORGANISM="Gonyaulax spinifera, Strain CCMP409" /LENGTH=108 /DNA_ID=CAMNT_0043512305 /DNA_START=70 /DNA_END=396 /DNA_ORIENTATION=+